MAASRTTRRSSRRSSRRSARHTSRRSSARTARAISRRRSAAKPRHAVRAAARPAKPACENCAEADRASGDCSAAASSALSNLQGWLGGDCRAYAECAGHSVCVSVLSGVASSARAGSRVSQVAPRAVDQAAPGGRVGIRGKESQTHGTFDS